MKGFALALLCFVAAVQARSAVVPSGKTAAALGDAPWLVHLRVAVGTSGFLETCAGALIHSNFVLTTAQCVRDARFIWIRYGVVEVIAPSLVTETSNIVARHPDADLAVVGINRVVHSTENIATVEVATSLEDLESASLCVFGEENGAPGEHLSCFQVSLQVEDGEIVAYSEEGNFSQFDIGAPLVVDGQLVGLLSKPGNGNNVGTFVSVADFAEWIEEQIS